MAEDIKKIIEELCRLDNSLKKHRPALERLLADLIANKPKAVWSADFKEKLMRQLMAKAEEIKGASPVKLSFWQGNWAWALRGGLTVSALILIVSVWAFESGYLILPQGGEDGLVSLDTKNTGNDAVRVEALPDKAFGVLKISESSGSGGLTAVPDAAPLLNKTLGQVEIAPVAQNMAAAPSAPPALPSYSYQGQEFNLSQKQVAVLRRKGFDVEGILSNQKRISASNKAELVDLSTFENLELQNINLSEAQKDGYTVRLDNRRGDLNISENIDYDEEQCAGDNCVKDIISLKAKFADSEAIKLADSFMEKHRIDLSNYGEAVIDPVWNGPGMAVTEAVLVLYPLRINGQEVWEAYGAQSGIIVNVNVKKQRVVEVAYVTSQEYDRSLYEAETDPAKILAAALKGGMSGMGLPVPQTRGENLALGDPVNVYMSWNNVQNGKIENLLVPALKFPVLRADGQTLDKSAVVVPLVKDLLSF